MKSPFTFFFHCSPPVAFVPLIVAVQMTMSLLALTALFCSISNSISPGSVSNLLNRARAALFRRGRAYFLSEDEEQKR